MNINLLLVVGLNIVMGQEVNSCFSSIYCHGELLKTIQMHHLFPDSKTFVDMSLKSNESFIIKRFENMMNFTNFNPSKLNLNKFVAENFEFVNETVEWTPSDFNSTPAFVSRIKDPRIMKFAKSLVGLWPLLGRKVSSDVHANPEKYSILPVPEGFIIPGGRMRELYYWDSYWIIKGLLISEMTETVKGMLNNMVHLIKRYGLIPNGSRIYYINRSQPPLFTSMVALYLSYTNDLQWLEKNINHIETELKFWLNNRTVNLNLSGFNYTLAHYNVGSNMPRPESYSEDIQTCSVYRYENDKRRCYSALTGAAESGWDFSTRWVFDENGGTNTNLSSIETQRIIPVDLNAFLCKSFRLLSEFYKTLGNSTKELQWKNLADQWQKTINTFLYDDIDGVWYDYDYKLEMKRRYFYPSNFAPLWTECYDRNNKIQVGQNAIDYYKSLDLDLYKGGIPTSLQESGEQWDLPNAWPPLQELIVLGFHSTTNKEAIKLAKNIANRWVRSNMAAYETDKGMYEKYDAIMPGHYGGGGEYKVQLGFGWSNGVALSLIEYLNSGENTNATPSGYLSMFFFTFLPLLYK